jgi:hypothetical protein
MTADRRGAAASLSRHRHWREGWQAPSRGGVTRQGFFVFAVSGGMDFDKSPIVEMDVSWVEMAGDPGGYRS